MTKTFSKVIAVMLSICLMFTVAVAAGAQSNTVKLSGGKLVSAAGSWDSDFISYVVIEVKGDVWDFGSDTILTVGTGDSVSNITTLAVKGSGYSFTPKGTFTVTVPLNININHAETYNFRFVEGALKSEDGALSEEYIFSVSGNAIIETLDVEHVSTKPIEMLIDWLYTLGAEGTWLDVINFVVSILNWFLTI